METSMPPPPSATTTDTDTATDSLQPPPPDMKPPMGPPPLPQNPNDDDDNLPESENATPDGEEDGGATAEPRVERSQHRRPQVPYDIPPWSAPPCHSFSLEVLKDGAIIDKLDVTEKGAYMFGRADLCDFVLENPTVSRFHAVLQFKESGEAFLYDLGSSHGSFINKSQVKMNVYVELHVGDVIRFGLSTRLYILQGPADLMPPETDVKSIKNAKYQQERQDRQASLRRAREQAALADGISWGMGEDAIEEDEDEEDEITWQNFKGELTEKQDKTRSKVLKRLEKIAHMKKEMDAIRAKDIPQGGLTQGQQTQIARNEQRISQLMEELENLEETLNDSIRESVGARTKGGISYGKKKTAIEDEEDLLSDEDEFFDRTKKKPSVNKSRESQLIETADTLLDKKEAIVKEMKEKTKLLADEKNKTSEPLTEPETGDDALDAYMSGLSSQLKHDTVKQIQKQLSDLQSELDRVLYLLKVADPTGEASKKRLSTAQQSKSDSKEVQHTKPVLTRADKVLPEAKKISKLEKLPSDPAKKQLTLDVNKEAAKVDVASKSDSNAEDSKPKVFTVEKPQWLGAVKDGERGKSEQQETSVDMLAGDDFVDYKDRDKILSNQVDSGLENAAPGLIIRKKKQVEGPKDGDVNVSEESTSPRGDELKVEDAVALLLKHKRGYHDLDEDANQEAGHSREDKKKPKRVLGPAKPSFLNPEADYESWVPPEGQSGDGRTSLNDRLGY